MLKFNRRKWSRHEKRCPVQIMISLQTGFVAATVSNFSRGGLAFLFHDSLDKGSGVMVRLPRELAGLGREVRARVKWCVPARLGGYAVGVEYETPLNWTMYE